MVLRNRLLPNRDALSVNRDVIDQLAGLTGLGWTASALGFAATLVGYGNSVVLRFVTDPTSLLYAGALLFLATLGLDHLAGVGED